jgi:hypothetical protein
VATLLLYLNTPGAGGETNFPRASHAPLDALDAPSGHQGGRGGQGEQGGPVGQGAQGAQGTSGLRRGGGSLSHTPDEYGHVLGARYEEYIVTYFIIMV